MMNANDLELNCISAVVGLEHLETGLQISDYALLSYTIRGFIINL